MLNALKETLGIFRDYGGQGLGMAFMALSVAYLLIVKEKREIKVLAFLCVGVLAIFFFPPFAYVAMEIFLDSGVYYRLLWLAPAAIISCYAAARAVCAIDGRKDEQKDGQTVGGRETVDRANSAIGGKGLGKASPWKARAAIFAFAILIAASGSLVYLNPSVSKAENMYHLPEDYIEVADVLHVDGRNVKAVVPAELLQFIRQYDPSIELAYGRDALVGWTENPLYRVMESSPIGTYELTDYAKQQFLDYIVLRTGTVVIGTKPIDEYEFSYLTTVNDYDIYIFDRSGFADEKKAEYESTLNDDRLAYYIRQTA